MQPCRLSFSNSENNVTKFRATRKYGQVNETWHSSFVSDVGPTGPVYSRRLLRMTVFCQLIGPSPELGPRMKSNTGWG